MVVVTKKCWRLKLLPNQKHCFIAINTFHISAAAIDTEPSDTSENDNNLYPVLIQTDDYNRVLCNLSNQILEKELDLFFPPGIELTFFTTGKATVLLTGYKIILQIGNSNYGKCKPICFETLKSPKYLDGGVTVEELVKGKGLTAMPGNIISIRYTRYNESGIIVEEADDYFGTIFILGEKAMMKCLNLGLCGMKVGSVRRIISPPAYTCTTARKPILAPAEHVLKMDVKLVRLRNF